MDGRHHAVREDAARARRQQPRDVGFSEPADEDPLATRASSGEHPGARSLPHLDVAVRAEDEHACVGELRGDEPQQEQRRRIGPVEIVEDARAAGLRHRAVRSAPATVSKS